MTSVAVVGPGAVGSVVAAAAERRGHRVLRCGRRPGPGSTVDWGGQVQDPRSDVLGPEEVHGREPDLVVVALKAPAVTAARSWLDVLRRPDTPVLVLQNGVEHSRGLEHLPAPLWVPGLVWCTAEATEPGRVVVRPGPRRLVVPAGTAAADAVGEVWGDDPLHVEQVQDFHTAAWHKLVFNAVVALEVLTLRRAEVFADPEIAALALALARECVAVARADGAALEPSTADEVVRTLRRSAPGNGTSMLYDRLAGRTTEWSVRNDVIRRLGRRHRIPTPVSDVLVPLLAAGDPPPKKEPT